MRPIKASVVLAGFVLLLFDASWIQSAVPELTISGTLFSENGGDLSCDRCLISLLANGVRPVATAFLDLGGHFSFRGVPRGSYTIHAEIDGFEDVNQPVDVHDGLETNVAISLVRKTSQPRGGNGDLGAAFLALDRLARRLVRNLVGSVAFRAFDRNWHNLELPRTWVLCVVVRPPGFPSV